MLQFFFIQDALENILVHSFIFLREKLKRSFSVDGADMESKTPSSSEFFSITSIITSSALSFFLLGLGSEFYSKFVTKNEERIFSLRFSIESVMGSKEITNIECMILAIEGQDITRMFSLTSFIQLNREGNSMFTKNHFFLRNIDSWVRVGCLKHFFLDEICAFRLSYEDLF